MIDLRLAEYVLALKENRLSHLRGVPRWCPSCGRQTPFGLIIRARGIKGCPDCIPLDRRCAHCGHTKPLTQFDVTKSKRLGLKIESYCSECRRERAREQYHRAQSTEREIVAHQICVECNEDKPARSFHRDHRYAGGLEHICKTCKAARWMDYIQTPAGRAAFEAAQARYRHGTR